MNKIQILPSILTNDTDELRDLVEASNGVVERIHIDIIDGIYADNKTISPDALENIEHLISWDFHLMVNNPVHWVKKSAHAGADRIIAQIEMMNNQREFVEAVTSVGSQVGLALDDKTGVHALDDEILDSLDVILVMSVPAGFGGQKFHESALGKIHELKELRDKSNYKYKISADGGITMENISDIQKSGADEVNIGRRLFKGDLKTNIDKYTLSSRT